MIFQAAADSLKQELFWDVFLCMSGMAPVLTDALGITTKQIENKKK